jgi:hypothetical protein
MRWWVELTVTPMPQPQESFWLAVYKLKPQRGTVLLLPIEKVVSWDYCSFFV